MAFAKLEEYVLCNPTNPVNKKKVFVMFIVRMTSNRARIVGSASCLEVYQRAVEISILTVIRGDRIRNEKLRKKQEVVMSNVVKNKAKLNKTLRLWCPRVSKRKADICRRDTVPTSNDMRKKY